MSLTSLAYLFVMTGLLSYSVTLGVRKVALRQGLVDEPNSRSSHTHVTPRGGGLSVVLVFTMVLMIGWMYLDLIAKELAIALLIGSVPVAVVGLIDDRIGLSASLRLGVHFIAVTSAFGLIGGLQLAAHGAGAVILDALGILACVWFLNLFNFMDGIDGIAATEATFVAISAAGLLALVSAPPGFSYLWASLGGASMGFLVHNWPRARIFLGDVGSGFLGFVIAMMMVASARVPGFTVWTAIVLVAAFGADATVTLLRRLWRGEPWSKPHREHAYQRLARRWDSHGRVTLLYLAVNSMFLFPLAAISIWAPSAAPFIAAAAFGCLGLLAWLAGAGLPDENSALESE